MEAGTKTGTLCPCGQDLPSSAPRVGRRRATCPCGITAYLDPGHQALYAAGKDAKLGGAEPRPAPGEGEQEGAPSADQRGAPPRPERSTHRRVGAAPIPWSDAELAPAQLPPQEEPDGPQGDDPEPGQVVEPAGGAVPASPRAEIEDAPLTPSPRPRDLLDHLAGR